GLDISQATLAEPPREPADPTTLTPAVLAATARRIAARTTTMGLSGWSWGEGVALFSLLRLARVLGEPPPPFVTGYVDARLSAGTAGHVNDLAPGAVCADLWMATGADRYRAGCERLVSYLDTAAVTRAPNGAIEHWPGGVWADTVYMAGLFLI